MTAFEKLSKTVQSLGKVLCLVGGELVATYVVVVALVRHFFGIFGLLYAQYVFGGVILSLGAFVLQHAAYIAAGIVLVSLGIWYTRPYRAAVATRD